MRVIAGESIRQVELRQRGLRLARRDVPGDAREVRVAAKLAAGPVDVVVRAASGEVTARCTASTFDGPVRVQVGVPAGQGLRDLAGDLPVTAVANGQLELTVVVTARAPGEAEVHVGDEVVPLRFTVAEQREVVTRPLPLEGPTTLAVVSGDWRQTGTVRPRMISAAEAAESLQVLAITFPADPHGVADPARPQDRVTLPSTAWTGLLDATGLGYTGRDEQLPWSHHGVVLRNAGDQALNVVLQSRVLGANDAFRPRVRAADGDTGVVSGLLRIPARGSARAVLPLFVDDQLLPEGSSAWTHELRVRPLGSPVDLLVHESDLTVRRGSTWVSVGFGLTLLFGLLGTAFALRYVPRWLRTFRTADLTTIAVFGTLAFVVAAATAVVGSAIAAVLGPFSGFVTGLVNDALRQALLATLIVLLPRPGTATLFLVVGWLMRGIALGGFAVDDLLFLGSRILFLEALLFTVGLSRGTAWRDAPVFSRWLRLSAGFATASLLSQAAVLVGSMVLYRLYYADWFVAATLLGPGFGYDLIACGFAVGFAESLRRVES